MMLAAKREDRREDGLVTSSNKAIHHRLEESTINFVFRLMEI